MQEDNKRTKKGFAKRTKKDFVPTELGSAIQANLFGRPTDKELMVADNPDPADFRMNEKEK